MKIFFREITTNSNCVIFYTYTYIRYVERRILRTFRGTLFYVFSSSSFLWHFLPFFLSIETNKNQRLISVIYYPTVQDILIKDSTTNLCHLLSDCARHSHHERPLLKHHQQSKAFTMATGSTKELQRLDHWDHPFGYWWQWHLLCSQGSSRRWPYRFVLFRWSVQVQYEWNSNEH